MSHQYTTTYVEKPKAMFFDKNHSVFIMKYKDQIKKGALSLQSEPFVMPTCSFEPKVSQTELPFFIKPNKKHAKKSGGSTGRTSLAVSEVSTQDTIEMESYFGTA
mmetsp:Transcript_35595/g.32068  ORF Transcript_35595/g.32068 Transcript_35595/m.32068 type:complete len:105 (+) Transcript_35595:34-348(+)